MPTDLFALHGKTPLTHALAASGLPRMVSDHRQTGPVRGSRIYDALLGQYVHQIVGGLIPLVRDLPPSKIGPAVVQRVREVVSDARLGNQAAARTRVSGLVSAYLQHLMPGPDAAFLGTEVAADGARLDLVWQDPTVGVFYDELKTWRQALIVLDEPTKKQVHWYRRIGIAQHGETFAGVRLLPVAAPNRALWMAPDGSLRDLALSPLALNTLGTGAA